MKRTFQNVIIVTISMVFFASCSNQGGEAKVDVEKLRPEIQKMEDAFSAAEKAKDASAVVAYYSDDAVSYGRNELPTVGKAAIQEKIAKRLAEDTTGNTNVYKVVDLFADGNTLVEIGSWTEISPAGTETGKGHYMSYFQKRGDKYVCVRDMSVTSDPAKTN